MSKDLSKCPEMEYFMDESTSDVVFIIEGQRLPANKLYLSFKSKVFKAMFCDKFKECRDKEVVIEETTFEAFKTLIQFFYSEQLVLKDENDIKLVEEVLQLSDRYEAFRLTDKINDHLNTFEFTTENIGFVSEIADKTKNKELIEKVMEFIDERIGQFINKDDNELIAINDSTHNQLLKVLANNYRKVKPESTNYLYKLSMFKGQKCKKCERIMIKCLSLRHSGFFGKCPRCKSTDLIECEIGA